MPLNAELRLYRHDCKSLVHRYEALLEDISSHLKRIDRTESEEEWVDHLTNNPAALLDSFGLYQLRSDLETITSECDTLVDRAEGQATVYSQQREIVNLLLQQLQTLKHYSTKVDHALDQYERKVISYEEELASNVLPN
ncbi:MAG: hypothetical protein QF614_00675 [SAR324 cluster bacterium]|nr:hypothetical protein [SAR324 cluster bacterium]